MFEPLLMMMSILLIVIVCFFIIGFTVLKEPFYNVTVKDNFTSNGGGIGGGGVVVVDEFTDVFKGTPIVEITALETRRFPFVVENVKNWYSTQPLVPGILGTDIGKECPGSC